MEKGKLVALILLVAGVALVLLAVPNMGTEVVGSDEFTVEEMRNILGPYRLPRGSYTLWMEDFREGEEVDQWNTYIPNGDGTVRTGQWPEEIRYQQFEGVESELISVIGDVPEGSYQLVLECDPEDLNGTTIQVFLVRSPGTTEGFLVVTGLTLVIIAVVVVLLTRKRLGEV